MEVLDTILNKYVSRERNDGSTLLAAAFAVVDKSGNILYSKAAGSLDYDPAAPSYTVDSVSWIASMTKLATSVSILQLVEKGAIGLDDDVRKKVPGLAEISILKGFDDDGKPILEKNTKPITLRILLSHTTGLGYDLAVPDLMKWSIAVGRTANCMSFSLEGISTPLLFEPGSGWQYGTGADWAGQLLEILTGQTLGQYMKEHIFDPLKMTSTTFRMADRPDLADRTLGFTYRKSPKSPLTIGSSPTFPNPEIDCGGNGLFSTPNDYTKLLAGVLRCDVLSEESTTLMFSPQLPEAIQKNMMDFLDSDIRNLYCPEFPRGTLLSYSLAGMLNLEDVPQKRRKGSVMWMGYSNPHWWIDFETGIAAVLFAQVVPDGDGVVINLYDELEREVYKELAACK